MVSLNDLSKEETDASDCDALLKRLWREKPVKDNLFNLTLKRSQVGAEEPKAFLRGILSGLHWVKTLARVLLDFLH
jgi:hypothetical protein